MSIQGYVYFGVIFVLLMALIRVPLLIFAAMGYFNYGDVINVLGPASSAFSGIAALLFTLRKEEKTRP